jgi:hypothetical protein
MLLLVVENAGRSLMNQPMCVRCVDFTVDGKLHAIGKLQGEAATAIRIGLMSNAPSKVIYNTLDGG